MRHRQETVHDDGLIIFETVMAKQKTHTPGPWIVRNFPGQNRGPYVTDSTPDCHGGFVGQLIASQTTCPDWEANARLIAEAPEMLAVLKEINEFFRHNNPVHPSTLIGEVTFKAHVAELIERAEGGAS